MSIGLVLHNNERTIPNDLFVSVNDLNAAGGPLILVNQRIKQIPAAKWRLTSFYHRRWESGLCVLQRS